MYRQQIDQQQQLSTKDCTHKHVAYHLVQLVSRQEVVSNSGMIYEGALGNKPSKMEITTCYALILFEATTEAFVRRYLTMIHAECVYTVQISDWLLIRSG